MAVLVAASGEGIEEVFRFIFSLIFYTDKKKKELLYCTELTGL